MVELERTEDVLEQGLTGPSLHGFQSVDESGMFTCVSKAQLDWLGYRAEEIVGKIRFEDLLSDKDGNRFRRRRHSSAANIEVYDLLRKDRNKVTIALRPFEVVEIGGSAPITMATTMNLDLLRQVEEGKKPSTSETKLISTSRPKIIELAEFSSMARRTKPECPTLHRMPLLFRNVANAHRPNTDIVGENLTYFEKCPLSKVLSDCLDHLANKPIFQAKDLSYNVSIMHSSKILVNQRVMELVLLNLIEGAAILALPHAQIRVLCHRSGSTFQILVKSFRRVDWASVADYYAASGAAAISPILDQSLPEDLNRMASRVAMCREIVGTLGGRVRSEFVAGPYATFVVQMPMGK